MCEDLIYAQGIGLAKGEESSERRPQTQVERRARPPKEQPLSCPRCDSTNTKFCYYNNYSLSQPRYFCKACRRYWTEGGTLRSVPVGGGSRKNKRSNSSSTSSSSPSSSPTLASGTTTAAKIATPLPSPSHGLDQLASKFYPGGHGLDLSFPNRNQALGCGGSFSALELLRSGICARGVGPFVPVQMPPAPGSLFGAGFGFQELIRPASNMKLQPWDGVGESGYSTASVREGGDGRLLFPFEDLKHGPTANEPHEASAHGQADPTLFWNGIMGGSGNGGGGGASW